ncbi:MAG TPA: type II toxin-antitoxin system RatA family toxin [Steroidobacteraceae bacterium]|nr:type II toxin-antitoxin system RatA family toxin [Steroidobacteraceae bacterium]
MREVKRAATVAQPPSRLYELINDIERYPQFVPGCTHARVEARSGNEIVATLGVRRGPLRAQFTTRNELDPDRRIHMTLVRGPFRMLEGEWTLTPVGPGACRIELAVRFAFANRLSAMLFEPLFQETAESLVDAFVARAQAV